MDLVRFFVEPNIVVFRKKNVPKFDEEFGLDALPNDRREIARPRRRHPLPCSTNRP